MQARLQMLFCLSALSVAALGCGEITARPSDAAVPSETFDAQGPTTNLMVGSECMPGPMSCGPNLFCAVLENNQPGECVFPCQNIGDVCPAYTGPGVAICEIDVVPEGAPPLRPPLPRYGCIIYCKAAVNEIPGCDDTQCNGSCPQGFECVDDPDDGQTPPPGTAVCL